MDDSVEKNQIDHGSWVRELEYKKQAATGVEKMMEDTKPKEAVNKPLLDGSSVERAASTIEWMLVFFQGNADALMVEAGSPESLRKDLAKLINEMRREVQGLKESCSENPQTDKEKILPLVKRAENLGIYTTQPDSGIGRVPGYESLELALTMAYQHAACSKGKERHASGLPFHEQPMQRESDDLGTAAGLIYQARKKVREGSKLPTERAQIAEMVGAINYIAGWIIWTLRQDNP